MALFEGYRYDGLDSQKAFEMAIDHSKKEVEGSTFFI